MGKYYLFSDFSKENGFSLITGIKQQTQNINDYHSITVPVEPSSCKQRGQI